MLVLPAATAICCPAGTGARWASRDARCLTCFLARCCPGPCCPCFPLCPPADKAADAAKQVALTVGAVGVCYGMLKVLYPLEEAI